MKLLQSVSNQPGTCVMSVAGVAMATNRCCELPADASSSWVPACGFFWPNITLDV